MTGADLYIIEVQIRIEHRKSANNLMRTHEVLFFCPKTGLPPKVEGENMNNLEKVSATLICSLEEIRCLHGFVVVDGRRICHECHALWPCRTSSLIVEARNAGIQHMAASVAHVRNVDSKTEFILQKIDQHFSTFGTDEAEAVIAMTHKLCLANGIQVFGFVNALGEHEYQVERLLSEDTSLPLWALTIGRGLGVRIFSPSTETKTDSFFESILQFGFAKPDIAELIEWWSGLACGKSRYVTAPLPSDIKVASQVVIDLCQATSQFCDDDWNSFNEFL